MFNFCFKGFDGDTVSIDPPVCSLTDSEISIDSTGASASTADSNDSETASVVQQTDLKFQLDR